MKNNDTEYTATGDQKDFPMRLNRFLATKGVSSRRGTDDLIERKKVSVNGATAELGAKVNLGDIVSVSPRGGLRNDASRAAKSFSYFAFYKPLGIALDPSSKAWRDSELGKLKPKVFPADLLEKDAEGLVILTNDSRISRALGEGGSIVRSYVVKTQEPTAPTFLKKLEHGVVADNRILKARSVKSLGEKVFSIATSASRKDVERMCEALRHTALSIKRNCIENISLKGLQPNARREIAGVELESFLKKIFSDS